MWSSAIGCIVTLMLSLLVAPLAAEAQPGGKMPRLGVLTPGIPPQPWVEAFRQGLRTLGYVEARRLRWRSVGTSTTPSGGRTSLPTWYACVWTSSWRGRPPPPRRPST